MRSRCCRRLRAEPSSHGRHHVGDAAGFRQAAAWWTSGDDVCQRVDSQIDVIQRVVQVEAQATAATWFQAEHPMGQRRAVAAGPCLDTGVVQAPGELDRIPVGDVERHQRRPSGRIGRPVDRQLRDGCQTLQRSRGQATAPGGDPAHGPFDDGPLERSSRAEPRRMPGRQREVDEDPQRLGGDDRAKDVGRARRILPRQIGVLDMVVTPVPPRSCHRRRGRAELTPAAPAWRTGRRRRNGASILWKENDR